MPQRHIKRERLETPYMHETPMNPRGSTYNHYMHPHPSYMHGAMPPFLHQNMRPPSQYPMIPPPHMPYGNISGVAPNHSFMMPQQSMSTYPMPQAMHSSSIHDSNVDANTFRDSYYTAPQTNINMDSSLPLHEPDFLTPAKSNCSMLPVSSAEIGRQTVPMQSPDLKSSVKHEQDLDPLPSSFLDYLVSDVKVEGDVADHKECADVRMTDVSASPNTTNAEPTRNITLFQDSQSRNTVTSDRECNVKKEESSGSINECIFIAD